MEMETLVRYNFPVKIVVLNNGGIGLGMPEIPDNPLFNMKPNSLIYGARYDLMMEALSPSSADTPGSAPCRSAAASHESRSAGRRSTTRSATRSAPAAATGSLSTKRGRGAGASRSRTSF
jgi:hypothetical protein